jgi:uncharacterized membrane protein
MTTYFVVKYLHVLGAIVILGTGTGIAFFMLMAHRSRDAAFIARTAAVVMLADMLTATGYAEQWLLVSLGLYVFAGLFWIPVVFMQIEMRDLARVAADRHEPLPERYFTLFGRWFLFGIPGFGSVVIILWLMIAKPF